jgi:hypothetical protein
LRVAKIGEKIIHKANNKQRKFQLLLAVR